MYIIYVRGTEKFFLLGCEDGEDGEFFVCLFLVVCITAKDVSKRMIPLQRSLVNTEKKRNV